MRRLTIAVAALVVAGLNRTVGRLPAKPPAPGEYVRVEGRDLHFVDSGGDGPVVVLLHGMSSTHADFERLTPLLGGVRILAVDRPGYGWSRGGPLDYRRQVDAVAELIATVDAAPAVVVGHSMGAVTALGLALRHREVVAGLVLVAPAAGGCRNGRGSRRSAHMIRALHRPGLKQVGDQLFNGLLRKALAHTAMRRAYGAGGIDRTHMQRVLSVTLSDENLDAIAVDRLAFNAAGRWLDPRCGSIACPTEIVAADDDAVVPVKYARRLAKMMPGATLRETIGGHTLPQSNPKAVAAAVRRVLAAL